MLMGTLSGKIRENDSAIIIFTFYLKGVQLIKMAELLALKVHRHDL